MDETDIKEKGLKAFHSVQATTVGIEVAHMTRKGQIPANGASALQTFADPAARSSQSCENNLAMPVKVMEASFAFTALQRQAGRFAPKPAEQPNRWNHDL